MPDRDDWLNQEEGSAEGFYVDEYDIVTTPNDFNTMTIFNFLENGSIELPIFQRNFTWDKKRASKLIESLILGLPVPQIFLYEESKNKFLILDGQQRLMSIYFFIKGRFPKPGKRVLIRDRLLQEKKLTDAFLSDDELFQDFSLSLPRDGEGETRKSRFEGYKYHALADYKSSFDLRTVRLVFIKQNEPKEDNSSIYEIYDRLNTGGVNLKPQEIRANLYASDFYKMLYEINKNAQWRMLLEQPEEDDYMRDVEIILRAFGMLVWSESYRPSMSRFLNRFSHYAKEHFTDGDISLLKDIFESFVRAASSLSPDIFKKIGKFSVPIFESVFAGTCSSMWAQRNAVVPILNAEKIQAMVNERAFTSALQEGTTKPGNITTRLRLAKDMLSS